MSSKSGFYIVKEVGGNNEREIKSYLEGIRFIEGVIEKETSNKEGTKTVKEEGKDEKLSNNMSRCKIKILSYKADIVRIFEAMFEADIISSKTTIKQIAEIFFNEIPEQIKFVNKYYSTRDQIKKKDSSSNSDRMLKFVMILIEKNFKKKEKELEKLIYFLIRLKKKNCRIVCSLWAVVLIVCGLLYVVCGCLG